MINGESTKIVPDTTFIKVMYRLWAELQEKESKDLNNVKAANDIRNDMDLHLKKYQRWIKK